MLEVKSVLGSVIEVECLVAELNGNGLGCTCGNVNPLEALEGLDRSVRIVKALDVNLDNLVSVKLTGVLYRNGDSFVRLFQGPSIHQYNPADISRCFLEVGD